MPRPDISKYTAKSHVGSSHLVSNTIVLSSGKMQKKITHPHRTVGTTLECPQLAYIPVHENKQHASLLQTLS